MTDPVFPYIQALMNNPMDFIHILDEIPLGILILDRDLRVVHLNRAFQVMTGFSKDMARGVQCKNILRSAACMTDCPVKVMQRQNRPVSVTSDIINLDRQKLPVRITAAQVLDVSGKVTGFIESIENLWHIKQGHPKRNEAYSFANIVGRSRKMEEIFQTLPMLAQSETSILITGETGTGKDLVAEAIHQTSQRAEGPFIKINCGALPETLLESEIFGHQKGAFTGAVENKPGRFKLAHNGTIFLTEIGDLPLPLQVKLLTFLDDKVIYPLGGTRGFNADVRIIAATHQNLEEMVTLKKFRKDLLFRLNVARIHLPPLREREGDVRLLLDHFLTHYARKREKKLIGFSKSALACLMTYAYEGNIRELKNIVEYAVNVAQGSLIATDNLPAYIMEPDEDLTPQAMVQIYHPAKSATSSQSPIGAPGTSGQDNATWETVEREMILDALRRASGKKNMAAQALGMSRSTLWRKLKHHNIQ